MKRRRAEMSDDIHLLSLVELADAIATRQLSAVEVMTATVARAERLQPVLNCFISLQGGGGAGKRSGCRCLACAGRGAGPAARRAPRPQGHVLPRGPRHHLRLAHPQGLRTRPRQHRPRPPSWCRRDLSRRAQHGRNSPPDPPATTSIGATCRNPWNRDHISGGSSSGSGAARRGPRDLRRARLRYRRLCAPAISL